MSEKKTLLSLDDAALRMREDWDRRLEHDYRYWMSDGVEDDSEMWRSGERDFALLLPAASEGKFRDQTVLELGCGVGRLLRPAASAFSRVIGVDVSAKAIEEGRRLCADLPNVSFVLGNGYDLADIPSKSIDCAFTFAALSSMPVAVAASYLAELGRVLKPGGLIRLQVYVGSLQETSEEDTLVVRCFEEGSLDAALSAAGFKLNSLDSFELPFEVSDEESGLFARIASATRTEQQAWAAEEVKAALMPQGENSSEGQWQGSKTEYLMALARAKQCMESGDPEGSLSALNFALKNYSLADDEIIAMRDNLASLLEGSKSESASGEVCSKAATESDGERLASSLPSGRGFEQGKFVENYSILQSRFPVAADLISQIEISPELSVGKAPSGESILSYNQLALSHREKPLRAGESWAERMLRGAGAKTKERLFVFGFGDAYHLRALIRMTDKEIHLVEFRPEVLKAALGATACRDVLERLASISLSEEEFLALLRKVPASSGEFLVHPQSQAISGERVTEARRIFRSAEGLGHLSPSIGVVGPLYGGSLPIAGYTASALTNLKQRVRYFDLSPFHSGFGEIAPFLRSKSGRGTAESAYIETVSQVVLEGITERPIDILICLAQAPLTPRALTEIRARGIITVMWFVEDCRRFLTWQEISRYYDYMFIIQKDEFPRLVEQAGAGRAIYLPVACDPSIHKPREVTAEDREKYGSEVSFVGAGYNNRRHVFSRLSTDNSKIWGTEWPACLPFTSLVQDSGRRISVEEYVKIFNSSTINLNLHSSSERDGVEANGDFVNPRTFELAACGAFQLVDERKLMPEKFKIGEELAVFNDEREMHEKIDYYLAHPEERQKIVEASRARVLANHTYEQRLKTMLEYIYADRFEELKARTQHSPWEKTLRAAEGSPELEERLKKAYRAGKEPTLDALVEDIKSGKGSLEKSEQLILFLHHVGSQITNVQKLRNERG